MSTLASPPPPPPYELAQPPPPPPPPPPPDELVRDGLVLGLGLGPGVISDSACDDCDAYGGLSLQGQLGGMVRPTVAVVGDLSAVLHGDDTFGLSHGVLAVAAQWWVLPKLWLKGGVGAGRATYTWERPEGLPALEEKRSGGGILLGAGIEFLQSGSFALDVQLRVVAIRYRMGVPFDATTLTNTSIHVGFNWY